ncbi:MAG: Ig-like domain-containing protein, partial [Acidobacteria bacterium]|nr:Ig-like domain-containing protein [Acidobacteriota bacterium]
NGDIWVLKPSRGFPFPTGALDHYDSTGLLLNTITRQQIETLAGIHILNVIDFVLDGRGDIIMSILEDLGPGSIEYLDFPMFNRPSSNIPGRIKVLRLAKDASRASVIADVDQNYYRTYLRNGQLVLEDFAGRSGGSHSAGLAIDPNGKIVVAHVNNLIWPNVGSGIFSLDPDTGQMTEVIMDTRMNDPLGTYNGVQQHLFAGLGGIPMPPWGGIGGATRPQSPGIEVDTQGNYLTGIGSSVGGQLRLSRTPIPPLITPDTTTGLFNSWVIETFPLSLTNPGTPFLINMDMALDSGGDVLVAGSDFAGLFPQGVFRVTPLGQFSQVAPIPAGAGGFGGPILLDVVPYIRQVAQRDLPALPQFKLETLRVSQQSCPGGADLSVSVTNTGSVDITTPVRVYFYDGDPEGAGVVIGSAEAAGPIAAGASVSLSASWPNPAAGIHQVYAGAVGFGSTPASSFMVCVPTPASGQDAIQLTPLSASANLGSSHTVTATVLDIYGNGIAGVPVTFDVTGANTATGSATTNASGVATFTYAGNSSGLDTIVASYPNGGASNSVTQDWTGAPSDTTPPVLSLPANIITQATSSSGAVVNFSATANDAVDGSVPVSCVPPSGSTFALGTTTVNCSASDLSNNSASGSFSVTVNAPPPPSSSPVSVTVLGQGRPTADSFYVDL